jgi:serine carboxypeptidase-like clade 4
VADDMLDFLQEFFEAHPELADKQFFVTGESYAVGSAAWLCL